MPSYCVESNIHIENGVKDKNITADCIAHKCLTFTCTYIDFCLIFRNGPSSRLMAVYYVPTACLLIWTNLICGGSSFGYQKYCENFNNHLENSFFRNGRL